MSDDPLEDLPVESRQEVVASIQAVLDCDEATAENIVRSTEPFWNAMEDAGGLVDSWGGGEFCHLLPRVLASIRNGV